MAAAAAQEAGPPGGRERWYEKAPGTPTDRFPVLGEALSAAARAWTDSFNALSASHGELAFKALRAVTVEDLAQLGDGAPIFASLRVPAWEAVGGLALGRPLVSLVVEALFGGDGQEEGRASDRPMSAVDLRIVDVIGGQGATALTAGFKEFAPTRVEFDRTQPRPDTRFLGKPGTPMLAAAFEMKAFGRTELFDVVLPLAAVESRATVWSGAAANGAGMDEANWSSQLQAELARAAMALRATIALGEVNLGAIAGWRVGDVLELPPGSASSVVLTCENEPLFRCDLGQSSGRYTVRIDERLGGHPPSRKDD